MSTQKQEHGGSLQHSTHNNKQRAKSVETTEMCNNWQTKKQNKTGKHLAMEEMNRGYCLNNDEH